MMREEFTGASTPPGIQSSILKLNFLKISVQRSILELNFLKIWIQTSILKLNFLKISVQSSISKLNFLKISIQISILKPSSFVRVQAQGILFVAQAHQLKPNHSLTSHKIE